MGKISCFFVIIAVLICSFLNSELATVNNMEARNYITAREILEDGSWLLPTMNGELRIAKPPLPTWITAVAMKFAGTDADLAANRIPVGICGVLFALFTFLLVRRITGDGGMAVTSVLVLITGLMFLSSVRKNFWDIYAHMAMAGAIWAMAEAFAQKERKNLYFLLFTLLMVFSFFSKGPVALWSMFIPFIASYCMVYGTKDLKENKWGLVLGFGFAALISASWPAYVYLNTPHSALAVASKESTNWFTYHTEAPWYYLLNIHQVAGIWLFFLLYAVIAPFIEKNWKKEEKLFVFWFILIVVFLSIVPEKKARYLMPAVVPGAALSAIAIFRLRETGARVWKAVYGPFCLLAGIGCIAAAGATMYYSKGRLVLIPVAIALTITGGMIISDFIRKRTKYTHLAVVAGICLALVAITPLKSQFIPKDEARQFMILREIPEIRGKELYFFGDLPEELIWAAGRKVHPIGAGQIETLKEKDAKAALITTENLGADHPGMRILRSLKVKRKTYNIYSPSSE